MRKIVRIDVKKEFVVKGRQFEGYKKIGLLQDISRKIVQIPEIEIFYYDLVATLFGKNSLPQHLEKLLKTNFLPVTVGGGIDNIEKVDECFSYGVDRIALNTVTFFDPKIVTYVSRMYGSQACIAHVEAKKINEKWCAMYSSGREIGNDDINDHILKLQELGVGEIILSSIDNDGMLNGFPLDLLEHTKSIFSVPVIISGGLKDFKKPIIFQSYKFVKAICISKAVLQDMI